MTISHCVVHEVCKEPGESSAKVKHSQELMPLTAELSALLTKLNRGFGGSRVINARFDESPGKLFSQKFSDYLDHGTDDQDFLEYSQQVLGHLETIIQGKSAAKGGYLLLSNYSDAEGERQGIFLIRNTTGRIFERTRSGFSIKAVTHLDTDQLAMACRIDLTRFRKKASSYLELTHRSENEVSAYFSDWIGAEATTSARDMTASLQDLLASVDMPQDAETGEVISKSATLERAYAYVRASPSKLVDIESLSEELYGSPAYLGRAAQERGIPMETAFRYDSAALREMVMMRVQGDGIDLRFPRSALEDGLIYLEGEGANAQIVISSPELVEQLLRS